MTDIARIRPSQLVPLHAVSLTAGGDGAILVTSPQQWSYGAELNFEIPGIASHQRRLSIQMDVENGVLGAGWLSDDGSHWITRGALGQGDARRELTLVIPAGTRGGKLVFDNWTEGGMSARGIIRNIAVVGTEEEDPRWAPPPQSADREIETGRNGSLADEGSALAQWRAEIRKEFRVAHRHDVPSGKRIEYFEKIFKNFDTPEEILELVTPSPTIQNFAKNIWEFARGKTTLSTYPWNVSIPVADLCNARCTFCTSWLDGRKMLDLDQLELFEPVIRHALLIGLVGHGEPLAHPRFDELCDRLEVLCDPASSIYTITNGFFLEKWREKLERINLHSYSISLNAATAETHDAVMGLGRDAFPRIIDSISHLVELSKQPGKDKDLFITLVVTQQNLAEIPAFIELGNRLGVGEIWLRSLLPQANLVAGLNYHILPPYLHPDFERLRRSAVAAIRASQVGVQADPAIWGQPLFSEAMEQRIQLNPPPTVSRETALRDRNLRHRNEFLYHQETGIFRGQPLEDGATSEVKWISGQLHVVTPKGSGAYAASVAVTHPGDPETRLRVEVDVYCEQGEIGIGLLDQDKNLWLDRAFVASGSGRAAAVEAAVAGQQLRLVFQNGADGGVPARGSIGGVRIKVEGIGQSLPLDWHTLTVHNSADALDDGTNPLNRHARFACKAVYYNSYINEFFYRVNPCCYLQQVPGFSEVRLDGDMTFMEAWNSPGMVELRRRLAQGPLFGACVRCPEKW